MANHFFYTLGVHGLYSALRFVAPWVPKVRFGMQGRVGLHERLAQFARTHAKPYWFHVASAGELEQAIPVMDELKRRRPDRSVLLTYFSPSGERAVCAERERRHHQGIAVPWDHNDYSPLDVPGKLTPIFETLRPRLVALVQRELWPNLISVAALKQVPVALIATYWPEAGPSRRTAKNLEKLSWIGTVDSASHDKLDTATPREVVGDPRAERVLTRKKWNHSAATALVAAPDRPLFLLASLHKEDLRQIYSLPSLMKYAPARWVVVPHEPSKHLATEIAEWLEPLGKARLWSEGAEALASTSPLIIDKVGFLAELYRAAHFVLIGGSYYYRVHNVWEPAAYFKPILTGRYIQNSAEARALRDAGWLKVCPSAVTVADEANRLLKMPVHYEQVSRGIESFILNHAQTSHRYAEKLLELGG